MSKRIQNLERLAASWATTARTISRWKLEGAPIDDADEMRIWLACRKNLPLGTKKLLQSESLARRMAARAGAPDLPTGAAAAMRRLETAEAAAFNDLQVALKEGNSFQVKLARDGWLRVSESLRRYDLMLEASRRDAGELVTRAELERMAHNFVVAFKAACVQSFNSLAPRLANCDAATICDELRTTLFDSILDSFAFIGSARCPAQSPAWLIKVASRPMADSITGADKIIADRLAIFSKQNPQTQ